jgi:hypothetical protein
MPYGIVFEAVENLKFSKEVLHELIEKRYEMEELIKTGIGNGKIPECSMTFEIVA